MSVDLYRTGCLRSHIAAWSVSYDLVAACFRCCMLAVRASYPAEEWWRERLQNHTVERMLGVTGPESVLLSANVDLHFATMGTCEHFTAC